jgi:hypothetical protein
MKNKVVNILLVMFVIAACAAPQSNISSTKTVSNVKAKNCEPDWVLSVPDNHFVGVSESTSLRLARDKARTNAMAQVAQYLNTEVEALVEDTANSLAGQDVETFKSTFRLATDKVKVSFAKDVEYSQCPTTVNGEPAREMYCLVKFDIAKEAEYYAEMLEAYKQKTAYKEASAAHKAQIEDMDTFFEKRRNESNTEES